MSLPGGYTSGVRGVNFLLLDWRWHPSPRFIRVHDVHIIWIYSENGGTSRKVIILTIRLHMVCF